MPLTSAQIVALACNDAHVPGMVALAGQRLNVVLQELCMTYDFALARKTQVVNLNQGINGVNTGVGPYTINTDYLRTQKGKQFYTFGGQAYEMVFVDQWEYDVLPVTPLVSADFPREFYVDVAPLNSGSAPQLFVWPPPSINVPVTIRYYSMMPDIATPEASAAIPWFSYQQYLIRRLAGEMMLTGDDDRAAGFLTDDEKINPMGAGVLLRKYLNLKDDPEGRAKTVELDRRRFGNARWNALQNTKQIGW